MNNATALDSIVVPFADPSGKIISHYEKLRPYGVESKLGIVPGNLTGQFEIDGCRVLVLICADSGIRKSFLATSKSDLMFIFVPTFSISSRGTARAARSLWKSMAVARAYEFGVYVGISDWRYPCEYHSLKSSSVGGLADPRPRTHHGFFLNLGRRRIDRFTVDIERVRDFRQHRSNHAFLSDELLTGNPPVQ